MVNKIGGINNDEELTLQEKIALGLVPNPNQQLTQQTEQPLPDQNTKPVQESAPTKGIHSATEVNATGSVYQGIEVNQKDNLPQIDEIKNDKQEEVVETKVLETKKQIPNIDARLTQVSSFAAQDGQPVKDASKEINSLQTSAQKNDDIAQQYTTQADTLTAQYSNQERVHSSHDDFELSNGTKSTKNKPAEQPVFFPENEDVPEGENDNKKKFKDYEDLV